MERQSWIWKLKSVSYLSWCIPVVFVSLYPSCFGTFPMNMGTRSGLVRFLRFENRPPHMRGGGKPYLGGTLRFPIWPKIAEKLYSPRRYPHWNHDRRGSKQPQGTLLEQNWVTWTQFYHVVKIDFWPIGRRFWEIIAFPKKLACNRVGKVSHG